jgi:restriction system protein
LPVPFTSRRGGSVSCQRLLRIPLIDHSEAMARGIWAEINRAAKAAAREGERRQRADSRAYQAALREEERVSKDELKAQARLVRATEQERKRFEKEAKELHVEEMNAQAVVKTKEIEEIYSEIDGLLAATLEVDDYVDLKSLKQEVAHPPIILSGIETPLPKPVLPSFPDEPKLVLPNEPAGLGKLWGKNKYSENVREAKKSFSRKYDMWQKRCEQVGKVREGLTKDHGVAEAARLVKLGVAEERYMEECRKRELEVESHNESLEKLIADLGYGLEDAVKDYVEIVLSNSIYPEAFLVDFKGNFDSTTAELQLKVSVPPPGALPAAKHYRYKRSADEVVATELSQKAQKDRYSGAVYQVALRTFHEIFEADRRALIRTISLTVGTETINPAIGKEEFIPFVSCGVGREAFLEIDLAKVVPLATLQHLHGAISKNPYALVPAVLTGIR